MFFKVLPCDETDGIHPTKWDDYYTNLRVGENTLDEQEEEWVEILEKAKSVYD